MDSENPYLAHFKMKISIHRWRSLMSMVFTCKLEGYGGWGVLSAAKPEVSKTDPPCLRKAIILSSVIFYGSKTDNLNES